MPDAFLAEFEMYVMLAVARLGDGAYGLAIRKCIESRTDRRVSVGALYTTLARLEGKGFLQVSEPEAATGKRGRPRRYCALTEEGRGAMRHSLSMLGRMAEGAVMEAAFDGASE